MPVIAAIFTNEKALTETLISLYELRVEAENVVIMSPNSNQDHAQGGVSAAFYRGGTIADTGIGLKEQSFYNKALDNGQTVVFVEVEMAEVPNIEGAIQGADRIDRL
ncbi:MAG: hypothetical protein RLP44_22990 [Aggregatilineales bacterium]